MWKILYLGSCLKIAIALHLDYVGSVTNFEMLSFLNSTLNSITFFVKPLVVLGIYFKSGLYMVNYILSALKW